MREATLGFGAVPQLTQPPCPPLAMPLPVLILLLFAVLFSESLPKKGILMETCQRKPAEDGRGGQRKKPSVYRDLFSDFAGSSGPDLGVKEAGEKKGNGKENAMFLKPQTKGAV